MPRLTAAQNEALDLLAAVAEETCLYCPFEPGDIQLLNNHVVFHGRTAYEDDADAGQERLLLRLWLAMPNSRRLPAGHRPAVGQHRSPARCAVAWCSRRPGSGLSSALGEPRSRLSALLKSNLTLDIDDRPFPP